VFLASQFSPPPNSMASSSSSSTGSGQKAGDRRGSKQHYGQVSHIFLLLF
jgi:hypothetical protein